MVTKMNKLVYDHEEDVMLLATGRKCRHSIDIGDFLVDLDDAGSVTAVEIFDASTTLGLSEGQLSSVKDVSMTVRYKQDSICIFLVLNIKGKEKDITIPLAVDPGHNNIRTESARFAVA
jgi:uncharacterized protein YuzE